MIKVTILFENGNFETATYPAGYDYMTGIVACYGRGYYDVMIEQVSLSS